MTPQPKITIITVCYNAVKIIEETIKSVINQNYPNIEYIIIDGGSQDGTIDIIKRYTQKISYWISEADKGIYDAMNKGIKRASGTYLNFMNAGDVFSDENVISDIFTREYEADYIVGIAKYKSNGSTPSKYWYPIYKKFKLVEILKGGMVNHQSSFIKKSLLKEGYDTRYRIIADELLFVKKVVYEGAMYQPINRIIAIYDGTGLSNQNDFQEEIKRERALFYEENRTTDIKSNYKVKDELIPLIRCRSFFYRFLRKYFGIVIRHLSN